MPSDLLMSLFFSLLVSNFMSLAPSALKTKSLFFFFFLLFRVASAAYRGSLDRGQIGATAASLPPQPDTAKQDPSHICDLHHSSQQSQIPVPLSEARD